MLEAREGPRESTGRWAQVGEAGLAAIGCSAIGDLAQEVELILSMEGPQGCYGVGVVWRMWEPL